MKIKLRLLLVVGLTLSIFPPTVAISENFPTVAAYQNDLLDLAFATATEIPADPHIKDRSRAQAEVVEATLKLNQPQRALNYIEKIDNWLRGAEYADLAAYYIQHGNTKDIEHYLDLASEIADKTEDWRKDNIKIKIAQVRTLLGEMGKADELAKGVADSEKGKLNKAKAMVSDKNSFDTQMKELNTLIKTDNFDVIKNALESSTELYGRFYNDNKRRSIVEKKIKKSWNKLPLFVRIDLMQSLIKISLNHADQKKALELVKETQKIIDSAQWPPQYYVPMMANMSALRFQAGDQEKAKSDADAMWALFNAKEESIVNIYRAESLRPLAEAYQSMNNTAMALTVYKKAIEEGYVNPNSRPRAEDLSATCISMVLSKVEPDQELWSRIRGIKDSLKAPW